ncbi:MAG: ATP-dependent Clp protease ATP-binding subunit [Alistipes sp.]|nr:ATP-dependent Clp protease ATP-binding subunit [Alistipes sp.]
MQIRISKALESIIAQTAFDATKQSQTSALKDCLMLNILRNKGSAVHRILTQRLEEWQFYQIQLRLERAIHQNSDRTDSVEVFFRNYIEQLCRRVAESDTSANQISTLHAAMDIIEDKSTHSSIIFTLYGIDSRVLATSYEQMVSLAAYRPDDDSESDEQKSTAVIKRSAQQGAEQPTLLQQLGNDLTDEARLGHLDPVIGREKEVERIIEILSRRKKNNPILIGEAGVGKSAIVEGLAQRIVAGSVPKNILGKRVVMLDTTSLVAGTKFRGEFEERIEQLMEELRNERDIILFIDEIHTIVGAGATQGSLDLANTLKPALARGYVQLIGATTIDEYRTNIESDSALERRFQRLMVEELNSEQTLQILKQIAPIYEQYHNVKYTAAALEACVTLSARYISERHQPDKAIDVMDECGSRHTIAVGTNADRPKRITADDVATCIASITGIPIAQSHNRKRDEIALLEQKLYERIIGQPNAISQVMRSIRRSRAGLKEEHRPQGVFLFVGPTGVGKTLLAKELSRHLSGRNNMLVRLDMSEYSERHSVARLIGSPPGYVGYGEGGQLTEAVRRHPYSVILLDEIEKAHTEVYALLLQLFDEGRLTDGSGRTVNFRNAIIIMTSNIGSAHGALSNQRIGYRIGDESVATTNKTGIVKALERHFAKEFLGRIDDIVHFEPLSSNAIGQIIEQHIARLCERLKDMGYNITIEAEVIASIASIINSPQYGVRELHRIVAQHIEQPIADMIMEGKIRKGAPFTFSENAIACVA